jgi:hypothetical protein
MKKYQYYVARYDVSKRRLIGVVTNVNACNRKLADKYIRRVYQRSQGYVKWEYVDEWEI